MDVSVRGQRPNQGTFQLVLLPRYKLRTNPATAVMIETFSYRVYHWPHLSRTFVLLIPEVAEMGLLARSWNVLRIVSFLKQYYFLSY